MLGTNLEKCKLLSCSSECLQTILKFTGGRLISVQAIVPLTATIVSRICSWMEFICVCFYSSVFNM